jgi:hypothetical protein
MQRGSGCCDLGQPPLDRRVNVFIGIEERERAGVELVADAA